MTVRAKHTTEVEKVQKKLDEAKRKLHVATRACWDAYQQQTGNEVVQVRLLTYQMMMQRLQESQPNFSMRFPPQKNGAPGQQLQQLQQLQQPQQPAPVHQALSNQAPGTPPQRALAPAPAPAATAAKQYTIKLAAKVRAGFEATSADLGVAHVGDKITEVESRVNAQGIKRVHYDRGWLSEKTADGRVILEPYDPLPPGWETQTSRSTGKMYYVNHGTGRSTFDRNDPMIPKIATAPAPAPPRSAAPSPSRQSPVRPGQQGTETVVDYEDDFEDDDGSPQGRASDGVGQQAGANPQQGQAGQLSSPGRQGQSSPGKRDIQLQVHTQFSPQLGFHGHT